VLVAGGGVAVGNTTEVGVQSAVAVKVGLGVLVAGTGVTCGAPAVHPATSANAAIRRNARISFLCIETNTSC
jgi:hypothetical protein